MHSVMKAEVPLLCLANKQDKPDAMSVQEGDLGGRSEQIDYHMCFIGFHVHRQN